MFIIIKKLLVCILIIMVISIQVGCSDEMIEEIKQEVGEEVSKEIEMAKEEIVKEITDSKDRVIDDTKTSIDKTITNFANYIKEWFGNLFRKPEISPETDLEEPKQDFEISPTEIAQREVNHMTDMQFDRWKSETGWNAQNGWPPIPVPINISNFTSPQIVDSFYGIDAYVRNKLYLGFVGEAEGKYNCAEYIIRFYQSNDKHKLFGNMRIENVSSLLQGAVPVINYYDNETHKTASMIEVNIVEGELPRPGDICYKFAHGYGHWAIVRGVDLETSEVIIIEQNYHEQIGASFQPARRITINSGTFFRVPW